MDEIQKTIRSLFELKSRLHTRENIHTSALSSEESSEIVKAAGSEVGVVLDNLYDALTRQPGSK